MPSTVAVPASGRRKPVIIFIVVDFPAPFGPRKPRMSPRFTEKETPSTARFEPYVLTRPLTSIIGRAGESWIDETSQTDEVPPRLRTRNSGYNPGWQRRASAK